MENEQNEHDFDRELEEIKREYVKDLKDKMSDLAGLSEEGKWEEIYRIGHQLKGSGSSYGLTEVSTLGEMIEGIAMKSDAVKLRQWLLKFQEIIERLDR